MIVARARFEIFELDGRSLITNSYQRIRRGPTGPRTLSPDFYRTGTDSEWVHSNDETSGVTASSAGLQVRASSRSVDHHGHDHCLICTPRREDFLASPERTDFVPAIAAQVAPRQRVARCSHAISLLRLAPKSSLPV